ncbi:MAG: hypothetical protein IKZ43_04555 [Acidaminococcaceae bacterium]|nr:hypothetical protein [Acidaminococcaceae bacterium]
MAGRFNFEITEHIAVLGNSGDYSTELNRVSFNGYPAKLDLRKWKDGQPLKGVTLSNDEARILLAALQGLELGEGKPDDKQAESNSGK